MAATTPRPNFYGCAFGAATCASGVTRPADGNRFIYRQQPTLRVTADDKSRTYGDADPPLTASIAGLVNGDSEDDALRLTLGLSRPVSSVGRYENVIDATTLGSPVGYVIAFTPGTLTVTPAPLTITADDKTRGYGAPTPPLTRTVAGLVDGETEAVISGGAPITTADARTPVSERPVIAIDEARAANYAITRVPGTLTITPAPLTISADDKARLEGTPNPPLTATYSGFVAGDTPALAEQAGLALATTANTNSPGGAYPIVATVPSLANYDVTVLPGTLTVQPRGTFETLANFMAREATSDIYGRNQGVPAMCLASGPNPLERTTQGVSILSIEWARVRSQPNLSQCIDLDQRNGCRDF